MNKRLLILLFPFLITACAEKESTWCLGSSIYDGIYITIKGKVITFPVDFNYIINSPSPDFDYNRQLTGIINKKEKTIVCNNGISFSIIFYTEAFLTIEHEGQLFNFGNTKYFVKE